MDLYKQEINSELLDSELNQELYFLTPELAAGQRIDRFLTENSAELAEGKSRSFWQKLLKQGAVQLRPAGGAVCAPKPNYQLNVGDEIWVSLPAPQLLQAEPEDIPLDVVFEDADVLVVNKPRGMVVHPAAGNWRGTLVNALLAHCRDLSGINGVLRPGIVHRLDKDTTGLIIVAKSDLAHQRLAVGWHEGAVNRWYLALLHGSMAEPGGTIDAPLGRSPKDRKKMAVLPGAGRHAVTHYQVLERLGQFTLVRCKLETGRTHQIRVHMKYLGYPLVGDRLYGPRNTPDVGMLLHSSRLEFVHPITEEKISLETPLPADFDDFLAQLRKGL